VRVRDLGAKFPSPVLVLDRGTAQLGGGVLAEDETGEPSERLAKTNERGGVGGRVEHQVQRPVGRIESAELDNATRTAHRAHDLFRRELELRALELELGPAGRHEYVAASREGSEAVVDEPRERLSRRTVVDPHGACALAERQAALSGRRERQQRAQMEVPLPPGLHDHYCTE